LVFFMDAAPGLWFRTRASISRIATSLRRAGAGLIGDFSRLFYVFMGVVVALSAICILVVLAGELDSFLRAPLGFKDEALTGLPSLAEVVVLPALGCALALWFVAKYLGSLSARWRCTEYYPETSADKGLRCWLAPKHSGQHFCEVSGRKYYWQACARCGRPIVGSEACEKCSRQVPPTMSAEQQAPGRVQLEELAQSRARALGWEDTDSSGGSPLERAVENAIKDAGASSLMQMGSVIKAARGRLRDATFDENELRSVVRARLLVVQQAKVDSDRKD
jgi:hypothetical protein